MKLSDIEAKYPDVDSKLAKLIHELDFTNDQIDHLDDHLSLIKILLIAILVINFIALFFQLWTLLGF
jgi:hypothetical protein